MSNVLQNQLADYGYNLVALPKADIWPLMLLYKVSDTVVSSTNDSVVNFFKPTDAAAPTVKPGNDPMVELEGAANLVFDADAGVSMLSRLLQNLGMGKAEAKLKLNTGNKLDISYEQITEDVISLLDLDNYITGASPHEGKFHAFEAKLKGSELYIISAVLKSNQFSIAVKDENGQSINVEADVKGIVNANVSVDRKKDNALTLSYAGAKPLVFAFKAQQIIYDHQSWWNIFSSERAGFHIRDQRGIVFKGSDDIRTIALRSGNNLLDI
jgi:hypothetical protein